MVMGYSPRWEFGARFLTGNFSNQKIFCAWGAGRSGGNRIDWQQLLGRGADYFKIAVAVSISLEIRLVRPGSSDLRAADIVFADPDNGLVDSNPLRRSRKPFGKQMPLSEARALADGRTAIVYHHNTRRPGGHEAEVNHWVEQLGEGPMAIRVTVYSCRTFFVLNPTREIAHRVATFCKRWANHGVRLQNGLL